MTIGIPIHSISGVHKDNIQNWKQNEMTINNGQVTLVYTRLLDTGDSQDRVFTGNSKTLSVMYAISGQNTRITGQHSIYSSKYYTLDFVSGSTSSHTSVVEIIKRWHGGIMWFAWNLFAYTGLICARYKEILFTKQTPPKIDTWFIFHSWCMRTAALLTLIGFILGVIAVNKSGIQHFSKAHFIVGLIIFIFAMLQPLNAVIRPHKEPRTRRRRIWEFIHKNSGRSALGLSVFNVFSGLILLGVSNAVMILQIIFIVIVGVTVIFLEIRWFLQTRTPGKVVN
ncbi:hypothetical protein RFI_19517 [Reticulomyxa filosa]|uniref:Cytochrome b561 domain-containing protein n=1 Tax=Reticulomyxa filosa TaxID=46433 RepID=X6MUX2_RETFI|nr:hypothetical protein RFI_19517 [Reticulomyxa filosa]|eukprot:ETO17798.1 hypothetical protein RFI_19517 [Reticulomyxa filosa]